MWRLANRLATVHRVSSGYASTVVHVRGRGLVVRTGCGHAASCATPGAHRCRADVRRARRVPLTGGLFEPIIGPTVDGLATLVPDVVPVGALHCTAPAGWRHEFENRLPDAFIPNSIGTRRTAWQINFAFPGTRGCARWRQSTALQRSGP